MKGVDRLSAGRREGEVPPQARRPGVFAHLEDGEPQTHVAEWQEDSVMERRGAREIGGTQRNMVNHRRGTDIIPCGRPTSNHPRHLPSTSQPSAQKEGERIVGRVYSPSLGRAASSSSRCTCATVSVRRRAPSTRRACRGLNSIPRRSRRQEPVTLDGPGVLGPAARHLERAPRLLAHPRGVPQWYRSVQESIQGGGLPCRGARMPLAPWFARG